MAELISVHNTEGTLHSEPKRRVGELYSPGGGIDNYGMDSDIYSSAITATKKLQENSIFEPAVSIKETQRRIPFMNLQWTNVCLTTKSGKSILKDLNGEVQTGELTAIMGPSGAGKTMLLNVLSGYTHQKASGCVTVNGSPREARVFRKMSCYIMQDDLLLPRLTVRESIHVAASLKMPDSATQVERQMAVEECMESLGLSDKQNQRAAHLSGGQRKRLCIALQLVSNPHVIFLDEPTSGLDSSACLKCIQLLKSLAEEGRTVVCSIHQPSARIYEIFDKLYMIADGHCIYRGPTKNLIPFLADHGLACPKYHSPGDFVTEVAMGYYGDYICRLKSAANGQIATSAQEKSKHICAQQELNLIASKLTLPQSASIPNPYASKDAEFNYQHGGYATSFCSQLRVLTYRSLLCIYREPITSTLRLASHVVVGILLGGLYYGIGNDAKMIMYNSGFLFFSLLFLIFSTLMPTALIFPMERDIFIREYMNSWYGIKAYYLAKSIAEIPFQVIFPVIYCCIVYWMTSQPNDFFRFCVFTWTGVMISFVAQSVGFLIGAAVEAKDAVFLAPVVTIPILLVSGFFISLENIPIYLRWMSYISYVRYCYQNILMGVYSMDRGLLDCPDEGQCPFQGDPEEFLKEMDMGSGSMLLNTGVVLAFLLAIRIAAYLVLRFKVAGQR